MGDVGGRGSGPSRGGVGVVAAVPCLRLASRASTTIAVALAAASIASSHDLAVVLPIVGAATLLVVAFACSVDRRPERHLPADVAYVRPADVPATVPPSRAAAILVVPFPIAWIAVAALLSSTGGSTSSASLIPLLCLSPVDLAWKLHHLRRLETYHEAITFVEPSWWRPSRRWPLWVARDRQRPPDRPGTLLGWGQQP